MSTRDNLLAFSVGACSEYPARIAAALIHVRYTLDGDDDDTTTYDGGKSQEELMEEEIERQLAPQDYDDETFDPNSVEEEFYDDEVCDLHVHGGAQPGFGWPHAGQVCRAATFTLFRIGFCCRAVGWRGAAQPCHAALRNSAAEARAQSGRENYLFFQTFFPRQKNDSAFTACGTRLQSTPAGASDERAPKKYSRDCGRPKTSKNHSRQTCAQKDYEQAFQVSIAQSQ